MNNIYETASDLHVRGSIVYVQSSDKVAYYDKGFTKPVNAKDLTNMFNMGTAIIVDTEVSYRAVSLSVSGGVATLSYVKAGSPNVEIATAKSKETEE